jgi:curved DNA-binding protein
MEYQDYYKILGVERNANADEIKKSYRRLARKYHPDVSSEKNAEEKFKQVKEAYEVLKDPEKRKAYDQMGANWKQGQGFSPPPGWEYQSRSGRGQTHETFSQGDFSDFFESLFGGMGGARGQAHHEFKQRGQDQHAKVSISLEDAYRGATRELSLQEPQLDPRTGQVSYQTHTLRVKIPAGVTTGQQIRLQGQGTPGMGGGPKGDLYLEIQVMPHSLYTLEGKDVYLNLPITPWEAALGAKISVPTLGGTVELSIPAGSQTGQKLRLKGRGLPDKPAGDQYVLLKIYIPEPKNEQQKQLYRQMAEQMQFDPRKDLLAR